MDAHKLTLKGSATRDDFKSLHKQRLPNDCYAFDVDLAWCGKYGILAFFDFKKPGDNINKNERIGYKILARIAPFYILTGEPAGPWTLERFEMDGRLDMQRKGIDWSQLHVLRNQLEKVETTNGPDYGKVYLDSVRKRVHVTADQRKNLRDDT